ncbi:hypothetical protein [Phyllobacterium bourgognense]|uniref:hypothetical protein n=1 Tax=Phyllobacterium bourgognense TaxID=314236 RepID=UPI0015EFEF82
MQMFIGFIAHWLNPPIRAAAAVVLPLPSVVAKQQLSVGQGALQLQRFFGGRLHPNVDFLRGAQDDRHRLFMDRFDDGIREGSQKREHIGIANIQAYR